MGVVGVVILAALTGLAHADKVSEVDLRYQKPLEEAVERGLAFLARSQKTNGAFDASVPATSTALSIMAFLAKGHLPGLDPYGDVINKGIDFVLDSQRPNGHLAPDGRMYGHNIALLMLSQVSGMVDPERQKRVDTALSKGLRLTLAAQQVRKAPAHQGGWRYAPDSKDSDMSLTGWAFMSIRSARAAGCAVPKEAIDEGVAYIKRCETKDGGFGYTPGAGKSLSLTGAGLLCLEMAGMHGEKVTYKAGDLILASPLKGGTHLYYTTYYCSQAMFQLGGKYWDQYAPKLYDFLLARQNADGSFQKDESAGPAYATAMGILSLSPSFRQLPIYQR
jgi:prenyltransferase beta subunit